MATAKSDDEVEEHRSHPLAQNRPGVYVQVVATPRKRKGERARSEAAASAPPRADSGAPSGRDPPSREEEEGVSLRASGVEPSARGHAVSPPPPLGATSSFGPELRREDLSDAEALGSAPTVEVVPVPSASTENTNFRADLMKVPGPPRMPSISLSGEPLPAKQQGASLLDAPRSLRPESLPSRKQTSWGLLAFVAVLSAIITAAGVVAVRERGGQPDAARETSAATQTGVLDRAGAARQAGAPAKRETDVRQQEREPPTAGPAAASVPVAAPLAVERAAAPSAAAAPAVERAAAPSAATAPAVERPAAAPSAATAPAVETARAPAAVPAPEAPTGRAAPARDRVTAPPARKAAPASVARRPAPLAADPSEAEAAPTPAQIIAEHARALAPVELPVATDTSLPANPYEAPSEE